ncbi:TIGR04086 family membrane protein [Alkaliphilus hydrothermalis]|uniref:Membrane protein (TIGR04086 family) n=1 Tax=Alkaliphilus hydrothermalis TaxID=1482730 RepID=A0ABS2NLU2_9FIRM|nr:TIGR04086 family membrane protein [Alkaliphilus hydrothermalis]MBM7613885.1 putative membrane protein (TIGR04086 family) [Alkaliphilus hydrothermalis]
MKKVAKKNTIKNPGPLNMWTYGRGLVRGYVLALMLFLLCGILITFTSLGESVIPMVTSIITILGVAYTAIYVVANIGSKGWLHGAVVGMVFMVLLVILSKMFITDYMLDKYVMYKLLISGVTGCIGGMIGINIK